MIDKAIQMESLQLLPLHFTLNIFNKSPHMKKILNLPAVNLNNRRLHRKVKRSVCFPLRRDKAGFWHISQSNENGEPDQGPSITTCFGTFIASLFRCFLRLTSVKGKTNSSHAQKASQAVHKRSKTCPGH